MLGGLFQELQRILHLVAKENISFHDRFVKLQHLLMVLSVQKLSHLDAEGMIKEGRELAAIAPNITVKLPMTPEGLKACSVFCSEGIKTNVTLIFSANQALLQHVLEQHMYLHFLVD